MLPWTGPPQTHAQHKLSLVNFKKGDRKLSEWGGEAHSLQHYGEGEESEHDQTSLHSACKEKEEQKKHVKIN